MSFFLLEDGTSHILLESGSGSLLLEDNSGAALNLLGACHALYAATSALTSLVPATSVYSGIAPPGLSLPWGVLYRVHNRPAYASGGTNIESVLLQFSFFTDSMTLADEIADAMKAAFSPTASLPITGGTVLAVYLRDDRLMVEPGARGPGAPTNAPWVFGQHLTFEFLVSRPT